MLQPRVLTPKWKDPTCHNEDEKSCMLQLKPGATKQINRYQYFFKASASHHLGSLGKGQEFMIPSHSLGNHSTGAPGFDMYATYWGHAFSVPQSCPTLCDTTDRSPPGSFVHGILQARTLKRTVIFLLQGIFLTQGPNPHLLRLLH